MSTCEFCHHSFTTKNSLRGHLKSAKFCLEIRGLSKSTIKCDYCKRTFLDKKYLKSHLQKCFTKQIEQYKSEHQKEIEHLYIQLQQKDEQIRHFQTKLETQLQEKDDKIGHLQTLLQTKIQKITRLESLIEQQQLTIEKDLEIARLNGANEILMGEQAQHNTITKILAEKPSTSSSSNKYSILNNNDMRVFHMDSEKLESKMNATLAREHIYGGQAAFAKYAVEYLLKDDEGKILYRCTDPSRKVFVYFDENGEPVRDIKATKLIQNVAEPLKRIGTAFIDTDSEENPTLVFLCKDNVEECSELNLQSGVFISKLSELTS